MKKFLTSLIIIFLCNHSFSQKKQVDYKFGIITTQEKDLQYYEKDSTANAVVLFEQGNTKFINKERRFYIKSVVYRKLKIFNKEGFNHATVSIHFYKNSKMKASVTDIKAVTHNSTQVFSLNKKDIYTTDLGDGWSETTFTLPNIKEGSVIEYMYTIETPFLFNFKGWKFQSSIPKVKSVFKAEIPGNFLYNRSLVGGLRLYENSSTIKKKCFKVDYFSGVSDCEALTYSMKDIPAFIEEDYMTSKKNFLSQISFELSMYKGFDGSKKKYTSTWAAVDKDFKRDDDIGGQLRRKSFFKGVLPKEIFTEIDSLTKAKKVYHFIQKHYTWNEEYKLFKNMNVKKAYNDRVGTVGEINMSLINALGASGINAELVLLSTRKNGFPTKRHPVISDFNYIVARVKIKNKIYLLDATENNNPFGILPFRCLNKTARVMDFKNGSYWEDIIPNEYNSKKINMLLQLNENGDFEGQMRIIHKGYYALNKRNDLNETTDDSYLEELESYNDNLIFNTYKNYNLNDIEKQLKEEFSLVIENDLSIADKIYLNPFFIDKIDENPFKLKDRLYPIDFGYPRKFEFTLSLELPDGYEVESLPKPKKMTLPNNNGVFIYSIDTRNYKIRVHFKYSLKKAYFYSSEYQDLKEFYKQMIIAQSEPIILKKI